MTERYYSRGLDGTLMVRDGTDGVKRRLFGPGSVFDRPPQDEPVQAPGPTLNQLAFHLLADALGDEAHARIAQDYFSRRVMPLLPSRWTMTRSRIHAYVEMIEHEKLAGLKLDNQPTSLRDQPISVTAKPGFR